MSSAPDPVLVEALADEVLVACAAGSMHSLAVSASGRLYYWGLVHVSKAEVDARPGEGNAATAATAAAAAAVSPSTTGATADSVAGPDVNDRAAAGDAREMLGLTGAASETLQRIVRESEQLWLTATDEDGPAEVYRQVQDDDSGVLNVSAGFNALSIVLRDEGLMRFVKYVSSTAPGSRWDVSAIMLPIDDSDSNDASDDGGTAR